MITQLLVQIEDAPETGWRCGPEQLRDWISAAVAARVGAVTTGPIPAVTVILEEWTERQESPAYELPTDL